MEVRQNGVGYVPQGRREGRLGRPCVRADTQYLGILLLEVGVGRTKRGDLVRSTTCERENMDREHNIFLAPVLTEGNSRAILRRQGEIRRLLTYFYHF